MLSQNPFLVATVRSSSEKLRLDDVEVSSFSKEFSKHFLWINIVYGVKIQNMMFLLCFCCTVISFERLITDVECCVIRVRQSI